MGQILIAIVIVLLFLGIVVAVLLIKILLSLRRATKVLDAALDDIKNFSKIIRNISLPFSLGRIMKKLLHFAATERDKKDRK